MSKTSEMQSTIQELRDMAAAINEIADRLFSVFGSGEAEAPAEKPPTLEEVRAILAEKARAGFTSEVRELLGRYGADRLSAADPKHYAAIVKEAEVLGNAG
ncbi:MAG: DNA ligase [Clostridia bacterium]|nr:DNA ligase [Clostridia bacterium]